MSAYFAESWTLWISAFCVLAVYSYLIKDNPVYRVMMQVFIGANLGYWAVVTWRDVLYPQWWLPMMDGFGAWFGGPGSPWGAGWALVGGLGLLFYFQLSRKYFWLSRIVIGITIGIGAGLTFKSQFGQNLPQVVDSFKPLAPAVVAPAPLHLLDLPGSRFAPVVDGNLAFFATDDGIEAVETLGGVTVWQTEVGATSAPRLADGRLFVQTPDGPRMFDMQNGRFVDASVPLPDPGPSPIQVVGSEITVRSVTDGMVIGTVQTALAPTAPPVLASFNQPQFDLGVLVVPQGQVVAAYALRDGLAPNVPQGELLWQKQMDEPIGSVTPLKGVLLVQSVGRSQILETPVPAARLQAKDYFDNWVFVITMVSVMTYFFFSFRMEGRVARGTTQMGRWLLMIGFGAFFGNTVMTRMSYLLDRLMFLIDDWLRPFFHQLS